MQLPSIGEVVTSPGTLAPQPEFHASTRKTNPMAAFLGVQILHNIESDQKSLHEKTSLNRFSCPWLSASGLAKLKLYHLFDAKLSPKNNVTTSEKNLHIRFQYRSLVFR